MRPCVRPLAPWGTDHRGKCLPRARKFPEPNNTPPTQHVKKKSSCSLSNPKGDVLHYLDIFGDDCDTLLNGKGFFCSGSDGKGQALVISSALSSEASSGSSETSSAAFLATTTMAGRSKRSRS